jgi:methionine-rich copper-binding protein CopC
VTRRSAPFLVAAAATLAVLIAPAVVAAHVELVSSTPAAGANLDSAPTEVTVTFDDELDPDFSSFTVTDADGDEVGGGEVDLMVADRNVLSGAVTITDPGVYAVTYAVTGIDGHEIDGNFSFGFNADEEIPEPTGVEEHEGPDTALPRPDALLATLGGALLLVMAVAMAVRRKALR